VNCRQLIGLILLGILTCMPSIVFGQSRKDITILPKIYQYRNAYTNPYDTLQDNVYVRLRFNVEKRNPTLLAIPSAYVFARGEKQVLRESYGTVTFMRGHDCTSEHEVLSGTIRGNRRGMPALLRMIKPDLYGQALYDRYMLSPFNRYNRRYYRYSERAQNDSVTRLDFRPKIYNTQLVNGYALVETATGKIIRTVLNGEFDMISFRTEVQQSPEDDPYVLPLRTTTAATFKFLGNRVSAVSEAVFRNPYTLHDSIQSVTSRAMMDSLRPGPLPYTDQEIYAAYDLKHQADSATRDTTPKRTNLLKKIFWDTIGETLVTPISADNKHGYVWFSPIVNPLQISWSDRRGLRYKMNFDAMLSFSEHRYLQLTPRFGYNFKFRQFYFNVPLRMVYNPKRNGYAEIVYGNGNRISNGDVGVHLNRLHGDSLDIDALDADKYTDNYISLYNNIMLFDWLDIETGLVMHQRKAVNQNFMRQYQMPIEFRSFSPTFGIKLRPWRTGPLFAFDWEKGIKGINGSNLDYEYIEIDAQWKLKLPGLRMFNFRSGGGSYIRKRENFFVDFSNFRDENLPEGWEDEWSGNFELLDSRAYNESQFYIRNNVSYDSPMLVASRIPYLGKYVERERFYFGAVLLKSSRPYFELGYSFTNRFISIGMFASFKGTSFQRIGFDFEYEIFRRW